MAAILAQRMAAMIDGDFVVFLIGMRINRWWKVASWGPIVAAMPRMLAELAAHPELGLLHARNHFGFPNLMVVQYWRSFEQLADYAADRTKAHLPAWRAFNQKVGSNGDVGIWHETYLVRAGAYETLYNNMPRFGLAQAGEAVAATGRLNTAKGRLGGSE